MEKGICWCCWELHLVNTCGVCEECWEKFPFLREGCKGEIAKKVYKGEKKSLK